MKILISGVFSVIIFLFAFPRLNSTSGKIDKAALDDVVRKKHFSVIRCSPDWENYELSPEEIQGMIPLPGTGSHKWKISTKSDSAQFYFNQAINLYYGFHIVEALPSFKKAQTFDPECAMLYWGEALAYGPNINDFGYAASPDALAAIKKANDLAIASTTAKEKNLIASMLVRYSEDSTAKRETLNYLYAEKMKQLHQKYPGDAEVGALYADALMIQHPWDLWYNDGRAKPWTPQIQKVLEAVLKYSPDHPGANHYYIHTMEASPFASKAKASADRLGRLTPGLAHMVHMSSHIYIRTGEYEKGVKVNIDAIDDYNTYLSIYPDVANSAFLYDIHARHMRAANSMNQSNYWLALKDAEHSRNAIDTGFMAMEAPLGNFAQYVYMTPEFAMITFSKWNDILKQPEIDPRFHYAALLQHFVKGMAYANTNDPVNARSSMTKLNEVIEEKDLAVVLKPFNSALAAAKVAKFILMGTIAEKDNRLNEAIRYYRMAVASEDSLIYSEPRDWLVPARHYLANGLKKAGKYKEAVTVFKEDLKFQPKNYLSTKGLRELSKYH